ncbi:hypothetical protein ACQWU4_02105 [Chryseobacterium sp. MIQD13]|uniref:hypothetical protein n=1 Tax=Chryseobacterium sp. MIQD13 TaxID=3422310 RepID=UPI003D2E7E0C
MKIYIKILSAGILLITSSSIYAQLQNVGISTSNPQQKLHIGGSSSVLATIGTTGLRLITPTIRIDGLNMANNPTVFSGADTTNALYVNNNGDTSVKKGIETFGNYTAPGGDGITTSTVQTITGNATYQSTGDLSSVTFTLQQRSQVFISSMLTAVLQTTTNNPITDGKTRSIVAIIIFTAAPASSGLPLNTTYVNDGSLYANRASGSITGYLKLSPSCEAVLPAGTYTVVLRGAGIASDDTGDNYKITWGAGPGDKLNVLSKPL